MFMCMYVVILLRLTCLTILRMQFLQAKHFLNSQQQCDFWIGSEVMILTRTHEPSLSLSRSAIRVVIFHRCWFFILSAQQIKWELHAMNIPKKNLIVWNFQLRKIVDLHLQKHGREFLFISRHIFLRPILHCHQMNLLLPHSLLLTHLTFAAVKCVAVCQIIMFCHLSCRKWVYLRNVCACARLYGMCLCIVCTHLYAIVFETEGR